MWHAKSIFRLGENIFLLHFSETPVSFFCLVEKYFSTKFFIPGGGNGFSAYWKPFWFPQSFSSVENVTEINGSQFLKKDHILTNEN